MSETRWRVPAGTRTAGHGQEGHTLEDLFARLTARSSKAPEPVAAPHPDFVARAAIWREQQAGRISYAEASKRSAAVGQAVAARSAKMDGHPAPRPRHSRPAPRESRQYAPPMSTEAMRDDRLTPGARAFLVVLRARCGKGRETAITKGTAGNIMSRSARTIRRYLVDLIRFGYVKAETERTARGLHVGLVVRLLDKCFPFYEEGKGLARWLAETPAALLRPFSGSVLSGKAGVTEPSPRKQIIKYHSSRERISAGKEAGRSAKPPGWAVLRPPAG